MRTIHISADREYDVLIDTPYLPAISALCASRSRVAIFFSESMKAAIPQLEDVASEIFYFPIPDGEAG